MLSFRKSASSENISAINDKILDQIQRDLRSPLDDLKDKLDSDFENGLNEDEVQTRQNYYGLNKLSKLDSDAENGFNKGFLQYFSHGFSFDNIALWLGGLCCIVLMIIDDNIDIIKIDKNDDLNIGLGLSVFCLFFGLLTYFIDAKCDYYIQSARDQIKYKTNVIREGRVHAIPYQYLVPGDVVLFNSGCRLFVDVKIITCSNLKVNSTLLNSREAKFYHKIYGTLDERIFEAGDILLHSTIISKGFTTAIVLNTNQTYLGNVPKEVSNKKILNNNHRNEHLSQIVYVTLFISLVVSITYALIALTILHWNWISAVILLVAVQVSITFESLYPTFLFAKANLVRRCVRKNCYIQNVNVLETIGMTNIICTNKTGIITDHRMVISRFFINNQIISSIDFLRQNRQNLFSSINNQQIIQQKFTEPYLSFFKVCSICNFALFCKSLDKDNDKKNSFERETLGKPSEVAILCYTDALFDSLNFIESKYPIVSQNVFQHINQCSFKILQIINSNNYQTNSIDNINNIDQFQNNYSNINNFDKKYSTKIYNKKQYQDQKNKQKFWLCLKGVPEEVLNSCGKILTSKGSEIFDEIEKKKIYDIVNQFSREGLRVLAIAQAFIDNSVENIHNPLADCAGQLEFLGLVAFINPIRLSICNSVFSCRRAGIEILMITSEHSETAFTIAKMSGISLFKRLENVHTLPQHRSFTIKGQELSRLSCQGLYDLISSPNDIIFTRISPNHKARIVEACVENNSIVAVTGIGIPDLEILEKAQIKIGLGVYGADVVKQYCDIILLDDEFTSIIHGIEAGRVLLDNLRKAVCYCMSSKFGQLAPFTLHAILGLPLMSSSITIVAIDLLTDNLPTMAIANEDPESQVMLEKPKNFKKNFICDIQMITLSLFYYGVLQFSGCAFSYIVVMAESGFHFRQLIGIRSRWNSPSINDLSDTFGQEWTYKQRIELEYQCNTVFFVNMVIVRAATAICCRTRYDSVFFGKGYTSCFRNSFVNFSIFFMFLFAIFFVTYPWFLDVFRVFPIKYHWAILSLPFAIVILILDEIRKYFVRLSTKKATWLGKFLFY